MPLRIYNTLSREKEVFEPLEPKKVRMYVCGITSYAPSHIGHARCYVAFDVIYRWLQKSYEVEYVRNFTDVDDKIIKAANAQSVEPSFLTEKYIAMYHDDMATLGCKSPTMEPKVTETIPEIIDLVAKLEKKGVAYQVDGDVYFEVAKHPDYGKLSGRKLEEQEAGARVDVDSRKRAPADFALWKGAKPGEPQWDSPWGKGRPGWHIECSAMSLKYLGEIFDIHGGGKDLVFPHHENEMAQSCAASGQTVLARYWLHNGFVNLAPEACPSCDKEIAASDCMPERCAGCGYEFTDEDFKMSKSRGNFYPIHEVNAEFEPEALRLLLLGCHYRSPIQFSHKLLAETEKRLDKRYETLRDVDKHAEGGTSKGRFLEAFGFDPMEKLRAAMDDDFNSAKAIAELEELFTVANDLVHGSARAASLEAQDKKDLLAEVRSLVDEASQVLGLYSQDPGAYLERRKAKLSGGLALSPAEIEAFIAERADARKNKNFARADEIRDELLAKGIVLKDGKDGTTWSAAS